MMTHAYEHPNKLTMAVGPATPPSLTGTTPGNHSGGRSPDNRKFHVVVATIAMAVIPGNTPTTPPYGRLTPLTSSVATRPVDGLGSIATNLHGLVAMGYIVCHAHNTSHTVSNAGAAAGMSPAGMSPDSGTETAPTAVSARHGVHSPTMASYPNADAWFKVMAKN